MKTGILKIGAHVSTETDLGTIFNHMDLKVIQVMFTNPRFYEYPNFENTIQYLNRYKKYSKEPIFVHSPYLVSFVKDPQEKQCKFTVEYSRVLSLIAEKTQIPIRFVTHLGVIPEGMSHTEAYTNTMKNLVQIHMRIKDHKGNFKVLLENDSGTRNRVKMNTAHGLFFIFSCNAVASWFNHLGWLGICFDTNHAYGSGFDRKIWLDFIESCDAIHFNPIPDFMELGSCQDRHSQFLLKDSKEKDLLKKLARKAKRLSMPMILENTSDIIGYNLTTLRSWTI